ncbi:hypothetical protein JTB14_024203 [Gonioctena quinquepunctata]|nr:hypothetical protein JTB14_024203 [Gonioctena quinquepunctata]
MEKLKEDVIKIVRGCIVSTKGRLQLRQLDSDYRTLIGEKIPYSKLGFRNLEEFLESDPTLSVININGETFVTAKILKTSAHISGMVAAQKTDTRKKLRKIPRFTYNSKPSYTSNWRPKYTGQSNKKYYTSTRPAAVSHNQFVDVRYQTPSVASRVVVPDHSSFNRAANTVHRQNSHGGRVDLSSRLHLAESSVQERKVFTNGDNVTVHTSNASTRNRTTTNASTSNKKSEEIPAVNSARQRISKKMSQISIDRDSGNSSPTGDLAVNIGISPTQPVQQTYNAPMLSMVNLRNKVPELVQTGDPIVDLKKFAEFHKLGEVEVSNKKVQTKQNKLHTCRIKVGKHSYNSYPQEFNNAVAAEIHCSKEALEDLSSKYGKRKSLLLASDKDILGRIPPLLEKHHHGIWAWQLQLDYADKYNEQLPYDWLKIIDSSPSIQIEKCTDDYILRHCEPGEKEQQWKLLMNLTDVSVPSNTVSFIEDGKLFAQVTCVIAANEIWCRQCNTDESDTFNSMISKMEEFYPAHRDGLKAVSVTAAAYYVTEIEKSWYRIRAISVSDTEVYCFLIDYGDEMVIPRDQVYMLQREFALSQAQAFVCRMVGLEELYEISANSEVFQSILYTDVTLELASDNVVKNDIIPVYMYDLETGKSINQEMIPLLTIESALPVLQNGMIMEVFISNIESNGDVYVQLHSHGYFSLKTLLEDLEAQITKDPPTHLITPVTKANSEGKFYFGKYKLDGHWYRIQLIDWAPNGELAQIYFIDYGHTDVINVQEEILYPLDTLSDILSQYPPQAVKVKMAIDEIPPDFTSLAKKAMPENQPVLLKVINEEKTERFAEFFKRNSDGGLFCINKSVTMEAEIKKGGDGNNNTKTGRRNPLFTDGCHSKNVPSGGKLKPPNIPEKQEYFEVHVPFAVNPYNFFVQPLESKSKLHQMMEGLQERYKEVMYSPLIVDQIIPGNIYASKFEDGNWYRTSVIKVIHSGSISVFYCDYGYYANLTVQQLIPLDIEFMELPYQALKAKLSNVKPKQSKWTMEDCDYFKEMVEKKPFYSVLIDIERDELYESDQVLKLVLIDTSTSEDDIYIGNELIKQGIAVEARAEEE